MKTRAKDINEKITWQELTTGVEIYEHGHFSAGRDW